MPGNPNYFAISLKLRLTSLTGTFTREKILSRLTYFYIFLVFWIAPSRRILAYYRRKKFAIFNSHRCSAARFFFFFFYNFFLLDVEINHFVLANEDTARPRTISFVLSLPYSPPSQDIKIPTFFAFHVTCVDIYIYTHIHTHIIFYIF